MIVLIITYGLVIGSFLNVCIFRIPRKESIVFPGSHCPKCNAKLKWYDNVPLLSYMTLRGKCRYCKSDISIQYPIVEMLTALMYIVLYKEFNLSMNYFFYSILSSILIVITFIDLKEMIIPDFLVVMIFILAILYKSINFFLFGLSINLLYDLGGLLLAGGIFLIIVLLSKGGMGAGDIVLISALGFVLGAKYILFNIFLSFILAAIISAFLLLAQIKTRKDPIPFAPFINFSFFLQFFGDRLL